MTTKLIQLKNKKLVLFRWIEGENIEWEKYRIIFVKAFGSAFKDFSARELNFETNNREQEFNSWYEDEISYEKKFIKPSFENSYNKMYFLEIETNSKTIGYSIWHWSPQNPTLVYQSSMCVLPSWQGNGIGTVIVYTIKDVLPSVTHFIVNTMKSEKNKANLFYRNHLKCEPCLIIPDETLTRPDDYIGYKGIFI